MTELLKKVNSLYKEVDEELDEKLQLIEKCIEKGMECPCEIVNCEIDYEKLEKLDKLYETEELEKLNNTYKGIIDKVILKA